MIITGLMFCYFFVAGVLFRDMLDDMQMGYWPLLGIFGISMFWLPVILWWILLPIWPASKQLWEKLARRLFYER